MAEEEIGSKEQAPKSNRILFCYFFIVLLLGLVAIGILVRAFDTAFVERETWMKVAESQKRPNRLIYPSRGNIYSSDGKLMATSVPCFYLYIDFNADCYTHPTKKWNSLDTLLKSKHNGIDSLSFYLSRKLKDRTPAGYKNYLLNGLKKKSRQFPVCDGKVSYSDLKEIKKFPFFRLGRFKSGFYTREMVERQKPFGTLASRTIGDTFRDIDPKTGLTKGKNGLELQYDTLLHGVAGLNSVRRLGGGWTNVVEVDPVEGMDIRTTIDINIQDIAEKSLLDMLKKIDAASGTAVVMEVATGEVKAITNMGRIREGVYGEDTNHAVADETEPGSTFKVASIMDVGSITVDSELLKAAGILEYELVQIVDIENGNRFETYTIAGEPGSGVMCLNGAAARQVQVGDHIILMCYASMTPEEAKEHTPKVVFVNDDNSISRITDYEKHGELFS